MGEYTRKTAYIIGHITIKVKLILISPREYNTSEVHEKVQVRVKPFEAFCRYIAKCLMSYRLPTYRGHMYD